MLSDVIPAGVIREVIMTTAALRGLSVSLNTFSDGYVLYCPKTGRLAFLSCQSLYLTNSREEVIFLLSKTFMELETPLLGSSSTAEQGTVNAQVAGSSPASPAKLYYDGVKL